MNAGSSTFFSIGVPLQEGAATWAWRVQRTQEDQEVRLKEEEDALGRYQKNAELLARLFTPTEEEIERGSWEGLGKDDEQSAGLDTQRPEADSGAATDVSSAEKEEGGKTGPVAFEGRKEMGTGSVAANVGQILELCKTGGSKTEGERKHALNQLQELARNVESEAGGLEGGFLGSPRKGKRKVEHQNVAKVGSIERFAQLLVDAGNTTSNSEIAECENAYLQTFKRACVLPRSPEGREMDLQAFGKQYWEVQVESEILETYSKTITCCHP